jgi:Protein of unknown function (DUF2628)
MRVFTVHEQAWSAERDRDAILVAEGFSFAAALFGPLWALANGLWRVAPALLAVEIALGFLLSRAAPQDPSAVFVLIAVRLAIGFLAHDWKRAALARRGYVLRGIVTAKNRAEAEFRMLATARG